MVVVVGPIGRDRATYGQQATGLGFVVRLAANRCLPDDARLQLRHRQMFRRDPFPLRDRSSSGVGLVRLHSAL